METSAQKTKSKITYVFHERSEQDLSCKCTRCDVTVDCLAETAIIYSRAVYLHIFWVYRVGWQLQLSDKWTVNQVEDTYGAKFRFFMILHRFATIVRAITSKSADADCAAFAKAMSMCVQKNTYTQRIMNSKTRQQGKVILVYIQQFIRMFFDVECGYL